MLSSFPSTGELEQNFSVSEMLTSGRKSGLALHNLRLVCVKIIKIQDLKGEGCAVIELEQEHDEVPFGRLGAGGVCRQLPGVGRVSVRRKAVPRCGLDPEAVLDIVRRGQERPFA